MIVTIIGGARSGKSSFAERWCMKHALSAIYVATGQAFDEEMNARINLHRQQRETSGYPWTTLEEPTRLAELLTAGDGEIAAAGVVPERVVLVDCLTLWLSNVLLAAEDGERADTAEAVIGEIDRLVAAVQRFPGTLVMVTNEVGGGIVPEYPLGRLYRDLAGLLNRKIAALSEQVFLVTAGIPIELKSREYRL